MGLERNYGLESTALSRESFAAFAGFITEELGIKMPSEKVTLLQSRLMRRLRELKLQSLDDYREYLFSSDGSGDELVHFINAVTTNKTDFFREPQHFDFMTNTVLPAWHSRSGRQFKLWCAGCSSGEEAYTHAMVLSEFGRKKEGFDFAILATDISTAVLDRAKSATYDQSRVEPVPAEVRKRYLLRSRDPHRQLVRIVPELRKKITFHRLNFMQDDYRVRTNFDVVFFRNVMIYFDRPTQEAVINKLCRNLRSGGYLFVGHSESLTGLNVPLSAVAPAVFRRNE